MPIVYFARMWRRLSLQSYSEKLAETIQKKSQRQRAKETLSSSSFLHSNRSALVAMARDRRQLLRTRIRHSKISQVETCHEMPPLCNGIALKFRPAVSFLMGATHARTSQQQTASRMDLSMELNFKSSRPTYAF